VGSALFGHENSRKGLVLLNIVSLAGINPSKRRTLPDSLISRANAKGLSQETELIT
jgi:hypothetical protein